MGSAASASKRGSSKYEPVTVEEMAATSGRMAVFSCKPYDREYFERTSAELGLTFEFQFFECLLEKETVRLAQGFDSVCVFVNDKVDTEVVEALGAHKVKAIVLRCAGFNNVDLAKAQELGITVARVPAYSPHAVAEHAVTLMLSLNRKIPQAWAKTRYGNFSIVGQMGFDMIGKRVGIVGTGLIGSITAEILKRGFKCDVVAFDAYRNPKLEKPEPEGCGVQYMELDELFRTSDIISLHIPLLDSTYQLVNATSIATMKPGVMIINTSRGALIHTKALIDGLKHRHVGFAGLDVYCKEGPYMFKDLSEDVVEDDIFARLMTFKNVIVTAHQAFFTHEAMNQIAHTTLRNADAIFRGLGPPKQGPLDTIVLPPSQNASPAAPAPAPAEKVPSSPAPCGSPFSVGDASPAVLAAEHDHLRSAPVQGMAATSGRMAVFSSKPYDREYFERTATELGLAFDFQFFECLLEKETVRLAQGFDSVCVFVNDKVDAEVVEALGAHGVRTIVLRCAGFNNVDAAKAQELGITVARVPAYSPHAIAEHAVALMLALNRKIPQAWAKTRNGNFSLVGQMGFDMIGKRVGIIGTGLIGSIAAEILKRGFKCDVVAHDVYRNLKLVLPEPEGCGVQYVELDELFRTSDIISLHAPLLDSTYQLINSTSIAKMKPGVMIINTSRGPLIHSQALIDGLKQKRIGFAGLDVYCKEGAYMFQDKSEDVMEDDVLARLMTFKNVIVTAHQAFFTSEAMNQIAQTTLRNADGVSRGLGPPKQGSLDTIVLPPAPEAAPADKPAEKA